MQAILFDDSHCIRGCYAFLPAEDGVASIRQSKGRSIPAAARWLIWRPTNRSSRGAARGDAIDASRPHVESAGEMAPLMNDVTRILSAIERGDPKAAEQLLPLVYDELRNLAAQKLGRESPGQTLQPTALVHEAYLRLLGEERPRWDGCGHFFAA